MTQSNDDRVSDVTITIWPQRSTVGIRIDEHRPENPLGIRIFIDPAMAGSISGQLLAAAAVAADWRDEDPEQREGLS